VIVKVRPLVASQAQEDLSVQQVRLGVISCNRRMYKNPHENVDIAKAKKARASIQTLNFNLSCDNFLLVKAPSDLS
jgi:hypothetical protein